MREQRPLIFRAYDTVSKEWLFGYDLPNLGGFSIVGEITLMGELNSVPLDRWREVDIMQFTGLVHKNGKVVYEGDILSIREYKNPLFDIIGMPDEEMKEMRDGLSLDEIKGDLKLEYISDVKWEEGCFLLMSGRDDYDMPLGCLFGDMKYSSPIFEFEIIGNLYDTPELFKR